MYSKSHVAGWKSDSPTPAQLKEFFSQIESGRITKGKLQEFLSGKIKIQKDELAFTANEMVALEILSPFKVLGYKLTCKFWNIEFSQDEPVVPFSKETLKQCAKENELENDWRLVYVHGFSLQELKEIIGHDRNRPVSFEVSCIVPFNQLGEKKNQKIESRYRLLNFSGRFRNKTRNKEDELISKTGYDDKRAKEQAVAEAYFGLCNYNCYYKLPLCDFYHRGYFTCIGNSNEDGIRMINYPDTISKSMIGVVISRR